MATTEPNDRRRSYYGGVVAAALVARLVLLVYLAGIFRQRLPSATFDAPLGVALVLAVVLLILGLGGMSFGQQIARLAGLGNVKALRWAGAAFAPLSLLAIATMPRTALFTLAEDAGTIGAALYYAASAASLAPGTLVVWALLGVALGVAVHDPTLAIRLGFRTGLTAVALFGGTLVAVNLLVAVAGGSLGSVDGELYAQALASLVAAWGAGVAIIRTFQTARAVASEPVAMPAVMPAAR